MDSSSHLPDAVYDLRVLTGFFNFVAPGEKYRRIGDDRSNSITTLFVETLYEEKSQCQPLLPVD